MSLPQNAFFVYAFYDVTLSKIRTHAKQKLYIGAGLCHRQHEQGFVVTTLDVMSKC